MRQIIKTRIAQARSKGTFRPVSGLDESGLVLLDGSLRPIAFDSGAVAILSDTNSPNSLAKDLYRRIPVKILDEVRNCKISDLPSLEIPFRLGTRDFLCRAFLVESQNGSYPGPLVALYLEADRSGSFAIHQLSSRCHITDREREALVHVSKGLSSSEVAERMNISRNTVKTVLRRVMCKMGVATRGEILAKLLQNSH